MSSALSAEASDSGEWRRNWPMVLAAMVGVSFVSVPLASLGLFMAPLQAAFGWSRTEVSAGLTILALAGLPLMPIAGMLVDRWGPRSLALPGLILSGLTFASFGLMNGSLTQWFGLWIAFTVISMGISIMVWTAAVSAAFTRSRGLALALVLCGSALAQAIAPITARWLIDAVGWRMAYISMGASWSGVAFVLALFLFRDKHHAARPKSTANDDGSLSPAQVAVNGLTVGQAFRTTAIQRIAFATFIQTIVTSAVLVHLVPLLTSIGLGRGEAASLGLVLATASVSGKLLTGWLIDRVGASWLPAVCYGGPAIALLLLIYSDGSLPVIGLAIAIQGYCAGASLQLATYLTTRYAGLRNFATIFGLVSTLMTLAAGLGPLIGGAVFDRTGGYGLLLTGGVMLCLLAGGAMVRLGRYPDFGGAAEPVLA